MKDLFKHIPHFPRIHVIIGAFDGVHFAHQELIKHAIKQAQKNNEPSLIFTFEPLPKEVFQKNFDGRILLPSKKKKVLENFKADYLIIADFKKIQSLSENEFIQQILEHCDFVELYSGCDFRMGNKNFEEPYQGSQVKRHTINEIFIDQKVCRSSEIRSLIRNGEIELANKFLKREYSIQTITQHGDKIGRSINFPTINAIPNIQLTPQNGVYFGEISIFNTIYPAAIYIGKRPSVNGLDLRIESHIICDFSYGEIASGTPVEIFFIKKISEEKKASSLEELKKMLYNYKIVSSGLATERYKNSNRLSE